MIKRRKTEEIIKQLKYSPAVGILGPRQVGKTTLAKELRKFLKRETVMLDMENPDDYAKMDNAMMYLRNLKETCVIIDEVQRRSELFSMLRVLIDEYRKPARFILLQSASPDLIKGASESLAGRISFTELSPFDITEVEKGFSLKKHWFRGGFPKSYIMRNNSESLKWLDDFISTYIERDLPEFGLITSPENLRRFWIMLANSQGGIWNASAFAKSLGISSPTVTRYLDFLEGAFVVRRLYPFHANIKKQLVKSPKVYVRDSGILHRLLRLRSFNELLESRIAGFSFEGYVVEQVSSLKNSDIDINYYRTKDGTESDIIFSKALKPVACAEVKLGNAPQITKGLTITMNDLKIKKAYIITPDGDDFQMDEKIRTCSVHDFVKKYLPSIK